MHVLLFKFMLNKKEGMVLCFYKYTYLFTVKLQFYRSSIDKKSNLNSSNSKFIMFNVYLWLSHTKKSVFLPEK